MSQTAAKSDSRRVIEHFNPAWFAAVMGTAVVPLAIGFLEGSWVRPVAMSFVVISVVMFVAILIPWTARFFMYPQAVREDLHHPITASFFPTMPIAIVVVGLDLLRYPDAFAPIDTSRAIAFWMWLVGTLGIYVMGFIILPRIYRSDGIELSHANFGWFIPPVANLLVPVAGFELAAIYPNQFELTFGLSMASFGIGFFLFLFVGALVYHRYVLETLPAGPFAATSFLAIAPTAIIAVVLFKLMILVQQGVPIPLSVEAVVTMSILGILFTWGFAAWAFIMAAVIGLSSIKSLSVPYALSWWAYTFPLGALAAASGVAWKVTGFESIQWFYALVVGTLGIAWLIVTVRTAHAVGTGDVFGSGS